MNQTPKDNLPIEYQQNYDYRGRSVEGTKIVEKRIRDTLEKENFRESFRVHVLRISYKYWVTRVYVGSYGNRKFIQSKRDESIDMERVIAVLREEKEFNDNQALRSQERFARMEASEALAAQFCKETGLAAYNGKLRIKPSNYAEKVNVIFEDTVSLEEAHKIVQVLKAFI